MGSKIQKIKIKPRLYAWGGEGKWGGEEMEILEPGRFSFIDDGIGKALGGELEGRAFLFNHLMSRLKIYHVDSPPPRSARSVFT